MADTSPEVLASMGRISTSELKVRNAEVALADARVELEREHMALRQMVLGGATTGDPFRNLFIKSWGFDEQLESAYRTLHDLLSGRKGEFVLIAYECRVQRTTVMTVLSGVPEFQDKGFYRLGVLEGEGLIAPVWRRVETERLILPVSCYIEGIVVPFPKPTKLHVWEGSLFDPRYKKTDPPGFASYMLDTSVATGRHSAIELVVGNQAVKAWLAKEAIDDLYKPAAHALGMLELEQTDAS